MNTEPAPDEPILKRHGRAIVIIALAAVVMGAAGTAYWRANVTSLIEPAASTARVAQSPISYPLAIPTQRSTGLVRGDAVSMLIQEYGGLNNQNPLGLIGSVQTSDPEAIRLLTNELNVLPLFPSDVRSCAMDDGSYFAIVLTYADGVTTPVKVEPTGCRAVSVGGSNPIALWAFDSPELFNTLRSLLAGHRVG